MKIKKTLNYLLAIFAIVVVFLISYHFFFSVKFEESYLEAVKSKRQKLEKIEYRKIIVTGDINATTSVDSELMEKTLGVPVVNMATNSSSGYKNILSYVKRDLNKGDVLIFSPGYDINSEFGWKGLSKEKIDEINSYFTADLFYRDNLKENLSISDKTLSENKDEVLKATFPIEIVNFLMDYNTFLKNEGVNFYLSPSFFVEGVYREDISIGFWKQLSKQTGVPLLIDNDANFLNKKHFVSTPNIISTKGRVIATKKILKHIKNKNVLNLNITQLIPKKELKSSVGLSNFNDLNQIKIEENNNNYLLISPKSKTNYIRIKHKKKNYDNFSFSVEIECNKEQLKGIKFIGTSISDFDYVIEKNKNTFEFFKENMQDVYYKKDKSSYVGFTLTDNINQAIKIKKVKLSKVSSRFFLSEDAKNEMPVGSDKKISFIVFNPHKKFKVSEIFNVEVEEDLLLNSHKMFRLETTSNSIYIRNFYTSENIYKQDLNNNFKLKSFENTLIEVFEQ